MAFNLANRAKKWRRKAKYWERQFSNKNHNYFGSRIYGYNRYNKFYNGFGFNNYHGNANVYKDYGFRYGVNRHRFPGTFNVVHSIRTTIPHFKHRYISVVDKIVPDEEPVEPEIKENNNPVDNDFGEDYDFGLGKTVVIDDLPESHSFDSHEYDTPSVVIDDYLTKEEHKTPADLSSEVDDPYNFVDSEEMKSSKPFEFDSYFNEEDPVIIDPFTNEDTQAIESIDTEPGVDDPINFESIGDTEEQEPSKSTGISSSSSASSQSSSGSGNNSNHSVSSIITSSSQQNGNDNPDDFKPVTKTFHIKKKHGGNTVEIFSSVTKTPNSSNVSISSSTSSHSSSKDPSGSTGVSVSQGSPTYNSVESNNESLPRESNQAELDSQPATLSVSSTASNSMKPLSSSYSSTSSSSGSPSNGSTSHQKSTNYSYSNNSPGSTSYSSSSSRNFSKSSGKNGSTSFSSSSSRNSNRSSGKNGSTSSSSISSRNSSGTGSSNKNGLAEK